MPPASACLLPLSRALIAPHPYLSNPCMTSSVWLAVFSSGQCSLRLFPGPAGSSPCGPALLSCSPLPLDPQLPLHWAWSLAGSLSVFVECIWTPAVFKYLKGHHVGEGLVLT